MVCRSVQWCAEVCNGVQRCAMVCRGVLYNGTGFLGDDGVKLRAAC